MFHVSGALARFPCEEALIYKKKMAPGGSFAWHSCCECYGCVFFEGTLCWVGEKGNPRNTTSLGPGVPTKMTTHMSFSHPNWYRTFSNSHRNQLQEILQEVSQIPTKVRGFL